VASFKILVARGDLSIGHARVALTQQELDAAFFDAVQQTQPDVVILETTSEYLQTIGLKIGLLRARLSLPLIVVADADDEQFREFRFLGASECLRPPVSILHLHTVTQHLLRLHNSKPVVSKDCEPDCIAVGSLIFNPGMNTIQNPLGESTHLTTAEARLLALFLKNSRSTITRPAIANVIYGRHRPVTDRAIDVVVSRLRGKLVNVGGQASRGLIRTEFRHGYSYLGSIAPAADPSAERASVEAHEMAAGPARDAEVRRYRHSA
jgi:DNA-binding response OmpR family regulator